MSSGSQESFDRVEFRWRRHEEHFARRLAEEAREAGRSQSDHARELLKNALTASDQLQQAIESLHQEVMEVRQQLQVLPSVKEGLRTVHHNIYKFRDNLATCVFKLLADAGRLNPKAAEAWVKETFAVK